MLRMGSTMRTRLGVHVATNGHAWSNEWACMGQRVGVHGATYGRAWSNVWACMEQRVGVHGATCRRAWQHVGVRDATVEDERFRRKDKREKEGAL